MNVRNVGTGFDATDVRVAASRRMRGVTVVEVVFWVSAGLLAYAQVGYPVLLEVLGRVRRARSAIPAGDEQPRVSLIVAAHREAEVIAGKVANARALEWPAGQLEVIVACDGSPDDTAARARAAGADVVLELPWGGKVRAQDAAVERASGKLLAFSDANALWEPDALRALAAPFADEKVGYACGQVRFVGDDGGNQEGLYWRYEMAIRARESQLASVTAGNGAIYAVRPEAYIEVDPVMGHDLSFPFNMVKRGWRAVYAPNAKATEKMVPTVEGEFARKRRMMSHAWPIVLRGGLLSPKGYSPLYALMILSHRVLRYAAPLLHLLTLIANALLLTHGPVYVATFALQIAVIAAALAGRAVRARPFLVARYYVLTTASVAAGLYDYLRHGTPAGWAPPEGTR
jgi:cellulose synthase/poly-beta-1,6-N-acetylglucosamine synthase-like glycosyltransferase